MLVIRMLCRIAQSSEQVSISDGSRTDNESEFQSVGSETAIANLQKNAELSATKLLRKQKYYFIHTLKHTKYDTFVFYRLLGQHSTNKQNDYITC